MKKLNEYASGDFLKAVNVHDDKEAFVITSVSEEKQNDREVIRLSLQKGTLEYDFDLNKTNLSFLINAGYSDPLELVSHKLYFKKALVRNPKTNAEVEGLRICKIE